MRSTSNDVGGVDPFVKIVADGARNRVVRCLLRSKNGGKVGTVSTFNTAPSGIEVGKKDVTRIWLVRLPNRPQRTVQRGSDDCIQENDSEKETSKKSQKLLAGRFLTLQNLLQ
jgi:hypothetical protein